MMMSYFSRLSAATVVLLSFGLLSPVRAADDNELRDQAIQAAVKQVAPVIVQIETSGGAENVGAQGKIRKGVGPTSGVIVAADGYIISSSFNFANKPAAIFISVPGIPERYVAEIVATDQTRMLTLLKLKQFNGTLPVPTATPKSEMRIGQTVLALGRTLTPNAQQPPSISAGIISALGRIWGKAIQTDAKVSPVNYGGPLVDLMGRVQGILVPASPQQADETTGIEWYDSGIGFAIPLEDIFNVLPHLKQGKDLKRGLLGVTWKSQEIYSAVPTVGTVAPGSAAEKAGIKPGDVIKEIDGKPVTSQAQVQHQLGNRYESDSVTIKISRGDKEITLPPVTLGSLVAAFGQPFLGILPMRDDLTPGVEVRYVYPKSPADAAGIKEGDRITQVGLASTNGQKAPMQKVANRDALMKQLDVLAPGTELRVQVKRKDGGKTNTLTIKLGTMPDSVPEKLPQKSTVQKPSAAAKAPVPAQKDKVAKKDDKADKDDDSDEDSKSDEDKAEKKSGLIKRTNQTGDRSYWVYVPSNYDPKIAHAVVIWLHPSGKNKDRDIDDLTWVWQPACEDQHIILVGPKTDSERGWTRSDAEFIQETLKAVTDAYTVDRQRIVVHGMGLGGEMSFYLGFSARTSIRGVAVTGAAMTSNPKEKVAAQPLSFYLVVGDRDPAKDAVEESKKKLTEFKYSVILREIAEMGHQYLDGRSALPIFDEMIRWIDSLDRI